MISKIWKKCNKCKDIKGIREFSKNRTIVSGYSYTCKMCKNNWQKTDEQLKHRREYSRKRSLNLVDSYVKDAAAHFFKCKTSEVDDNLIPFFREKMKLNRILHPNTFGHKHKD